MTLSTIRDTFLRVKDNKTLRDGGLYSLYSFIGKGVSFVLLIYLAKYILPADYGNLSLFSTLSTLLSFFIGLSSFGYVSVSYFKETENEFKKDFTVIFSLYVLTTIILMMLLVIMGDFFSKIFHLPVFLLWYAVIGAFCSSLFFVQQDLLRIKEKVGAYGVLSCGNAFFNFILSIVFVVYYGQSWLGRINAQMICSLIFFLTAVAYFVRLDLFDFHLSLKRYRVVLLWCLPIIPHLTTNWIRQGCDRYIIDYNYSIYEVGIFSFALTLVSVFNMIGYAFNSTNSVNLYKLLSNKEDSDIPHKIEKHTKMVFWIYTIACILLTILFPPIVFFFLPKYIPSLGYFFFLSIFGYLECLYYLYINYLFYYGRTKVIMVITFGTSLLHLSMSLLLTRYSLYYTAFIYIFIDALVLILIRREAISLRKEHGLLV